LGTGFRSRSQQCIRIPVADPESQDYIAACDVVVTKSGYSTIAEAISARIPVVFSTRSGMVEDDAIAKAVNSLGVGVRIPTSDLGEGGWFQEAVNQARNPCIRSAYDALSGDYAENGNMQTARMILTALEAA